MEESKNKTKIKSPEKENKNLGKEEKTLLEENKAENKPFPFSQEKDLETEKEGLEEAEKTEFDKFLEKEGFVYPEVAENLEDLDLEIEEEEEDLTEDDLGFNPEDLEDIPVGEDLFEEVVEAGEDDEPRTKTAGEVKEKLTSSKNAALIEKATLLALNKVDLVKAKLCGKISGQHFVEYLGDEETLALFIEALKVYLEQKEVREPSPFATLMFTLAMWTLPPLGMALLERFEVFDLFSGKEQPQTETSVKEETKGEAASDQPKRYAQLKEYQAQRKKFSLNADGKYNHTPDGKTYIHVEHANEYPSPVVKAWIDEGKKNKEIIKLLAYGE